MAEQVDDQQVNLEEPELIELESVDTEVTNALSLLKSPKPSSFGRKRVVVSNKSASATGETRARGKGKTKPHTSPKKVTVKDRINEFKFEPFRQSAGKLFCDACKEEISKKVSIIRRHIISSKHKSGKTKIAEKEKRNASVIDSMRKYDETVHPVGEKLPDNQRLYRVKVISTFLKAGVSLNKLDDFRDLLEEGGFRLTSQSNMRQLIPFVHKEEEARIKAEVAGRNVSVVFDGTTRLGEALAIVLRYITDEWEIQQRLVRLQLLAKSVSGDELARELISVIGRQYHIETNSLLAAMRDGASVNAAAMRTVKIIYPNAIDVRCFSHTIDRVGHYFNIPTLRKFIKLLNNLFSHSPATRMAWNEQVGIPMPRYSPTRWWSWWEVAEQVLKQFGDVLPFIRNRRQGDQRAATLRDIDEILSDARSNANLRIELAATVDAGRPMVESTYKLEGDGCLVWKCYQQLSYIQNCITTAHLPNTSAISRELAAGQPLIAQQWHQFGLAAIQPGWDYFQQTMQVTMQRQVQIFKAAQFFDPSKICDLRPTAQEIDVLTLIDFLNDPLLINDLKVELPMYLTKAEGIAEDVDSLLWWRNNEAYIPHWASSAKKVLLLQPSSASSERVFSILATSFGHLQDLSLQDYIESSLMLQFNKR